MREWSVTTGTAYPCVVMCMELLTAGTVLLLCGCVFESLRQVRLCVYNILCPPHLLHSRGMLRIT